MLINIKSLELKVPPPVVFIIAGGSMFAISGFHIHIEDSHLLLSCLIFGLGVCIALAAIFSFYQSRTTIDPHQPGKTRILIVSGALKYSRNPMYLSLVILLIGWSFLLNSLWVVIIIVLFVLYLTYFQIKPEEKILREKFSITYEGYCNKVRRWL